MIGNHLRRGAASAALLVALAAAFPARVEGAGSDATAREKSAAVDINAAPAAELEKLPGVGPSLARRIVEYREKNGPFGSIDDLLKVQGIGEKSLARFRDLVVAGKPPKK